MHKVSYGLAGLGIAVSMALPVQAQTASIGNATTATVNGTFDRQSITTSFADLRFQYGTLTATGAGTFSFSYLGNESGWTNAFSLNIGSAGVLTEQSALGSTVSFVVGADNLMPSFTFMTMNPFGWASASNGQSFTDNSNPSFAIISNRNGGNVMASYGGASHGFQYVLGFNDAYSGDRDFDDYKVGVNFVAAPVPEPSTYALMLAGLAAVGFMARRRKA
ncbi:MAG: PEP-CTERM sorting domain-containing protein [Aquincola sp.]|nr:PEP-CTERM sorting domain-containing protein [Aquincola sp.]MDH5328591.1 PEP-CTERM sorting domain-containing protein [Aquincola sp.]